MGVGGEGAGQGRGRERSTGVGVVAKGVRGGLGVVVSQAQKMGKKWKKKRHTFFYFIFRSLWWPISSLAASVYSLGDA
jgi:predicted ribonuclease toxin of YeeF-YezG toxin-antitoxin module